MGIKPNGSPAKKQALGVFLPGVIVIDENGIMRGGLTQQCVAQDTARERAIARHEWEHEIIKRRTLQQIEEGTQES